MFFLQITPTKCIYCYKGKLFILMLAALCVSFLLICFFKRQLFSLWSLVSPLVFFVCRGVQAWNYTQHIMWYFGSLSNSFASYQRKIKMRSSWITWSILKRDWILSFGQKISVCHLKWQLHPNWIWNLRLFPPKIDILEWTEFCVAPYSKENRCVWMICFEITCLDTWKNPKSSLPS